MCGRFLLKSPPDLVGRLVDLDIRDNFPARYNIAPTQPIAVIRQNEHRNRDYALMRWGFIPNWAKKVDGRPLINARSETAVQKPTFRSAFKRRRCIIPADGFYEWRKQGAKKQPFCIQPADQGPIGFAGIWETATDPDGSEIDTAAILTTASGPDLNALHHREPVRIAPADIATWLGADERDLGIIFPMLQHAKAGFWKAEKVSLKVNAVRNDGPDLIIPYTPVNSNDALSGGVLL